MKALQQNQNDIGLARRIKDAVMDSLNGVANAAEKENTLSPAMIEKIKDLRENLDRATSKLTEILIVERKELVEKLKEQNNV